MLFVSKFSLLTGKTTIHAPSCRNAAKRRGETVQTVDAADASDAARIVDERGELTQRQFLFPTVCRCAQ